jgi:membrane protease YdiL (CAAX protease family)
MSRFNKWGTFGRVVLFCLCCTVTLAAASGITKSLAKPWDAFAALSAAILLVIGFTYLFSRWECVPLKDIGMVPGKYSLTRILLGFIIGFTMAGVQPLLLLLFSNHIRFVFSTQFPSDALFTSLFLYSLVAIREEIAFRAYPLRALNKAFGPWVALFMIFIVFSLEHVAGGMSWAQAFIGPGVGSILFGLAALYTKGLAMSIGLHIAWNFGQWVFGFKDNTGIWHAVVDKGYTTQVENMGFIAYLVIMTIAIAGFYLYNFLKKNNLSFQTRV